MSQSSNKYWMYSKYSIEFALKNSDREIYEILIEKNQTKYLSTLIEENNLFWRKKIKKSIVNKKTILKKIGSQSKYQGIAVLVEPLVKNTFQSFLNSSIKTNNNEIILLIDKLYDIHNLGSILRSAYIFGVKYILLQTERVTIENSYLASIASGALEKVTLIQIKNTSSTIKELKKKGWWILGLESNKSKNTINFQKYHTQDHNHVLVVGSESKGLRKETIKSCDILLNIPMKNNDIGSLNVTNATSIALSTLSKINS
jgi:23S rRNA (guanosine2251-2'-O)-methyltransferase